MIPINRSPTPRQLRLFSAVWFPALCLLVGLSAYRRLDLPAAAYGIWGAAVAAAVVGLARPSFMRWLFVGLIYATYPIGWVMSNVLLLVVYYLVLTPIGLLLRLRRHDAMARRFDAAAQSYWLERSGRPELRRYFRQY